MAGAKALRLSSLMPLASLLSLQSFSSLSFSSLNRRQKVVRTSAAARRKYGKMSAMHESACKHTQIARALVGGICGGMDNTDNTNTKGNEKR